MSFFYCRCFHLDKHGIYKHGFHIADQMTARELEVFLERWDYIAVDETIPVVRSYTADDIERIDTLLRQSTSRLASAVLAWRHKPSLTLAGRTTPRADAYLAYWLRGHVTPAALLAWAAWHGATQLAHDAMNMGASVAERDYLPLRWAMYNCHYDTTRLLATQPGIDFVITIKELRVLLQYDAHDIIWFFAVLNCADLATPLPHTLKQCRGNRKKHQAGIDAYLTAYTGIIS